MDKLTQEKLKSLIGKEVKVIDYFEEENFIAKNGWVLVIEIENEKYELRGPGGYDRNSEFELKKIEDEEND